jgi:hypothetical protein
MRVIFGRLAVTREKVREVITHVKKDARQSSTSDTIEKVRRSIGGIFGALSSLLPSASPSPAKTKNTSDAPKTAAFKTKGGISKSSKQSSNTSKPLAPTKRAPSGLMEELRNMLTPSNQRVEPNVASGPDVLAAPPSSAGRAKQRNLTQVLGLPSQQLELSSKRAAGVKKQGAGAKTSKKAQGCTKSKTAKEKEVKAKEKVKDEATVRMALRPKGIKKGFYSFQNLEKLAWCKGQGTRIDPFVID